MPFYDWRNQSSILIVKCDPIIINVEPSQLRAAQGLQKTDYINKKSLFLIIAIDMYPINSCRVSIILITSECQGYQITITCYSHKLFYLALNEAIFFPRFILCNYFSNLLIYGGLGFWGWGIQLMWFRACGVGPSGLLGVVALYINMKEYPGKKKVPE